MKKSRFTDSQIAFILRQAEEGTSVEEVCRKPTDNAFVESFNGKFRAECLNTAWFLSLVEAQVKCEAWRRDYNEVRPHSSIGHQTPAELIFASGQACLA